MYCVWPRCAQGVWRGENSPAIHPSWRQRGSVCSVHSLPPWCLTFTHTLSGGHIQYTCVCVCALSPHCMHSLSWSQCGLTNWNINARRLFKTRKWHHLVQACVCVCVCAAGGDQLWALWQISSVSSPPAPVCIDLPGNRCLSVRTCVCLICLFLQEEIFLCSRILLHYSQPPGLIFYIPTRKIIASYAGLIRWQRN